MTRFYNRYIFLDIKVRDRHIPPHYNKNTFNLISFNAHLRHYHYPYEKSHILSPFTSILRHAYLCQHNSHCQHFILPPSPILKTLHLTLARIKYSHSYPFPLLFYATIANSRYTTRRILLS